MCTSSVHMKEVCLSVKATLPATCQREFKEKGKKLNLQMWTGNKDG